MLEYFELVRSDGLEELFGIVFLGRAPENEFEVLVESLYKSVKMWAEAHVDCEVVMLECGIYSW